MPPPSDRRPGVSRRAQYGIFTGYLAAVAGVLAGIALLAIAALDPGSFAFVRGGATELAAPAGSAARAGSRGVIARIGDYVDAADKNAAMRREVALARVQQVQTQALA